MLLGYSFEKPQLGGAEYAFALVYGVVTTIVGVIITQMIGLPRPWSPHVTGAILPICMMYSMRPFPERLRDNRFWLQRSVVYLVINVGATLLLAWLYSVFVGGSWPVFTSIGISSIVAYLALALPRLFSERVANMPRLHVNDAVLAVVFSTVFHCASLLADLLFGHV